MTHGKGLQFDQQYRSLFDLADDARNCIDHLLATFNHRHIKLFDLSAGRRIFLFILTRSIKTYSSIVTLCRHGYGQDVSTLLRGFLENLITAEYILYDPEHANNLAARFVAYKWVIFKRTLPEQEKMVKTASRQEQEAFYKRKTLVMKHVDDFKTRFQIVSDRALMTWSGKTVRDMAKHVSLALLAEYEDTFRQCSKFSHLTILGDQEYMIREDKKLTFSPQPSAIGIDVNLKKAIKYFLDFAYLVDDQFDLKRKSAIDMLIQQCAHVFAQLRRTDLLPDVTAKEASPIKDCSVVFKVM